MDTSLPYFQSCLRCKCGVWAASHTFQCVSWHGLAGDRVLPGLGSLIWRHHMLIPVNGACSWAVPAVSFGLDPASSARKTSSPGRPLSKFTLSCSVDLSVQGWIQQRARNTLVLKRLHFVDSTSPTWSPASACWVKKAFLRLACSP